ncbi:hypothetical protein NM208_g7048 [Fusarium decemcellulare]|uniref:Uncharacterized protein n=1 Tax=Fusarium decemcellulare TaxID=57161 RepID=A0ACC1SAU5_9HYPO|nr:hypothetical protein NM208_g7048 [Fusarium decemcellulare]
MVQHDGRVQKRRRVRRRKHQSAKVDTPSQPRNDFAALRTLEQEDSEGEDCELHTYENRYDGRGNKVLLRVGTTTEFELPKDSSYKAALVLFRTYSRASSKHILSSQLEIRSRHIKKALREVIGTYPGVSLNSTSHVRIDAPPMCLFHYRVELQDYATQARDPVVKSHVELCLGYMARVLQEETALFDISMIRSAEPSIEHQHLWMAFRPGILLYQKIDNVEVVSRLREIDSHKGNNRPLPPYAPMPPRPPFPFEDDNDLSARGWRLEDERIQYDGQDFVYVKSNVIIHKYDGCKPLRELKVFPLDLHPERERILQSLTLRGQKYLSLCGTHYRSYNGLAKFSSTQGLIRPYNGPETRTPYSCLPVHSRIMIDGEGYESAAIRTKRISIEARPLIETARNQHMNLEEGEALICCHEMGGFDFARREWALFNVEHIQDVQFNSDAFQQLVFSHEKKRLIQSLVDQRHAKDSSFDDLIKGKGKGLIFLLHGPPGVGKTFTAGKVASKKSNPTLLSHPHLESIADYTKRPLFQIGSGQLTGFVPSPEHKLSNLLSYAKKWNALVLIDEADVFLQERSLSDVQRNELVSTLLRVLEYFQGIMFLTTNRVETIDSAFHSRIHLSLAYPPLSTDALRTLWKSTIARACTNGNPHWLNKHFLNELARFKVNGREIKNIVHMAHAVANNEKRGMKAADIRHGLDALESFKTDFHQGTKRQGF